MGRNTHALNQYQTGIMIDKKNIKKMLSSVLRRSRGLSDHNLMHPTREWFSGLGVATVLLIIGTSACIFLYWEYNTIEPETAAEIDAPATIYQEKLVADALAELTARAARHEAAKKLLETRRVTPIIPEEVSAEPKAATETATSTEPEPQPETPQEPTEPKPSPELPSPDTSAPEAL